MSTPTNGSWNDNPNQGGNSGPNPQYPGPQQGGYGQPPQQSIGQGYGQGGHGAAPAPQGPGPQFGQQAPGQGGPQGGFGQQAGNVAGQAGAVVAGAGDGIGDLFSDFQFKKGLTEKIASLVFLLTVVWAAVKFIRVLVHAWGSQDFGGQSVRYMGGFEAFMTSVEALAVLALTVAVARLLLELFINVARIAAKNKS